MCDVRLHYTRITLANVILNALWNVKDNNYYEQARLQICLRTDVKMDFYVLYYLYTKRIFNFFIF